MNYCTPILALAAAGSFWFAAGIDARTGQDASVDREGQILEIQLQIEQRNLPEANRLLDGAAKRFPDDPGLYNLRGVIAAQQGDYDAAERDFREAVKRAPRLTAAHLNLGRLYQEHLAADPQARRKALDIYLRVLAYEPPNSEAHYQAAVLLLEQGEYQLSLEH